MIAVNDPRRALNDTSLTSWRPLGNVRPSESTSSQSISVTIGCAATAFAASSVARGDNPVSHARPARTCVESASAAT